METVPGEGVVGRQPITLEPRSKRPLLIHFEFFGDEPIRLGFSHVDFFPVPPMKALSKATIGAKSAPPLLLPVGITPERIPSLRRMSPARMKATKDSSE